MVLLSLFSENASNFKLLQSQKALIHHFVEPGALTDLACMWS